MTCIAWDGKTLSGDRMAVADETPVKAKKIFKVTAKNKTYLLGFSGDEARGLSFVRDIKKNGLQEDYLKVKGVEVLIVTKNQVYLLAEDGELTMMNEKKWALGTSGDFALGAMHAGVNSKRAVEIANRLSISSGMGTNTVKF